MSVPAHLLRRSSVLLGAASVVLAAGLVTPVHADPGGQPNGNSASARDDDGKPGNGPQDPKPGNGPKDPNPGNGPKDPNPGNPNPGEGDGDGPGQAPAEPGDASDKIHKVVICKYVRTPGEAEVGTHVIVVDYHALEGKGFDGTFPYPFSDGQVGSVAIRWAEKGESAREISLAGCPTTATPDEEVPEEETPDEVGGGMLPGNGLSADPALVEDDAVLGAYVDAAEDAEGALAGTIEPFNAGPGDVLPEAGASAYLRLAAIVGGLLTLAGAALLIARRRSGSLA